MPLRTFREECRLFVEMVRMERALGRSWSSALKWSFSLVWLN